MHHFSSSKNLCAFTSDTCRFTATSTNSFHPQEAYNDFWYVRSLVGSPKYMVKQSMRNACTHHGLILHMIICLHQEIRYPESVEQWSHYRSEFHHQEKFDPMIWLPQIRVLFRLEFILRSKLDIQHFLSLWLHRLNMSSGTSFLILSISYRFAIFIKFKSVSKEWWEHFDEAWQIYLWCLIFYYTSNVPRTYGPSYERSKFSCFFLCIPMCLTHCSHTIRAYW